MLLVTHHLPTPCPQLGDGAVGRQRVQVGHGSHQPRPTSPFVLFKDELVFCLDSVLLGLRNTHYLDLLSTWRQGGLPVQVCGIFYSTPTHSDPLGLALSLMTCSRSCSRSPCESICSKAEGFDLENVFSVKKGTRKDPFSLEVVLGGGGKV